MFDCGGRGGESRIGVMLRIEDGSLDCRAIAHDHPLLDFVHNCDKLSEQEIKRGNINPQAFHTVVSAGRLVTPIWG